MFSHEAGSASAVEAMLEYEDTVTRTATALADKRASPTGDLVAQGAALCWRDIPIRKERVS